MRSFDKLDQKYFKSTSNVLSKPDKKIRLDSIVDLRFENYILGETKPTKNFSYSYTDYVTYRITNVFEYNLNTYVDKISVYKGFIDDIYSKGGVVVSS